MAFLLPEVVETRTREILALSDSPHLNDVVSTNYGFTILTMVRDFEEGRRVFEKFCRSLVRESLSPLSKDPVTDALTDLNLAPLLVDWILEYEAISNLKDNWERIISAVGEYKRNVSLTVELDIGFSALAYLTHQIPTETGFAQLRKMSIEE